MILLSEKCMRQSPTKKKLFSLKYCLSDGIIYKEFMCFMLKRKAMASMVWQRYDKLVYSRRRVARSKHLRGKVHSERREINENTVLVIHKITRTYVQTISASH